MIPPQKKKQTKLLSSFDSKSSLTTSRPLATAKVLRLLKLLRWRSIGIMITSTITDLNIEHRQGMEPVGSREDSGRITENQSHFHQFSSLLRLRVSSFWSPVKPDQFGQIWKSLSDISRNKYTYISINTYGRSMYVIVYIYMYLIYRYHDLPFMINNMIVFWDQWHSFQAGRTWDGVWRHHVLSKLYDLIVIGRCGLWPAWEL